MTSEQTLTAEELSSLVLRSQDGDTEAFGKIYDEFLTPVYRYIVFRFPEDQAEDLVADVFVKAWEKLASYRVRAGIPFSAWLFRIARHTLIDAYRSTRGFDEISEELPDTNTENDPSLRTERSISVATVRGAINMLSKSHQDVLLLHYVAGLSHSEVARALRMTEGHVRILKFRALKKLEGFLPKGASPDASAPSL